jgi:hypothetical protein
MCLQIEGVVFVMRHELLRESQGWPVFPKIGPRSCLVGIPSPASRYSLTRELPIGAQARLMRAAAFSQLRGHPINAHLVINAGHLQRIGEGGVFGVGHLWDGFQVHIELMRHWVTKRGVIWACIWAREWAGRGHNGQAGEHWHIALHLPRELHGAFAEQVAIWTGEGIGQIEPRAITSASGAWHLGAKNGRGGPAELAVYLGKAEPSIIKRYGRRVPNPHKPRCDKIGGTGPIEGKRFGICKTLGPTEQGRN